MKKNYLLLFFVYIFASTLWADVKQPANLYPSSSESGVGQGTGTYNFAWFLSPTGTDPDGYWLEIASDAAFTTIVKSFNFTNTGATNANENISSLSTSTQYWWRIRAYSGSGPTYSELSSTPTTFYTGTILPVELSSFTATVSGGAVNLKWSTATEVNNYGFNVERSTDNKFWTEIGFVAGAGNSSSPKNYSFTDQPDGAISFSYRLKQIDVGGAYKYYDPITVSLSGGDKAQLMQNSPNPFNPSTAIKYYVPQAVDVAIAIYDVLGREVTKLVNGQVEAGYHVVYWNGRDRFGNAAASGVYIYRLTAGNFNEIKKMNLLK